MNYNEFADKAADKITDLTDGVEVKKLNVEVEKDGKTYKLDVNDTGIKAEAKDA